MKIMGTVLILLALAAIIAMYHKMMQEMYDEAAKQEMERRFDRECDFRWRNQEIKIHSRIEIVDEMR